MDLRNQQLEFIESLRNKKMSQPAQLIYKNNYVSTFAYALQVIYPSLVKIVGKKFFNLLVRDYLTQFPCRDPCLQDYGEYFYEFLKTSQQAKQLNYLSEVAQFEWAYHRLTLLPNAFNAEATFSEEILTDRALILKLNSNTRLLTFTFPILDIIDLCNQMRDQEVNLDSSGVNILLYREDWHIKVVTLNNNDFQFLSAIQFGASVATLMQNNLLNTADADLIEKIFIWLREKIIIAS